LSTERETDKIRKLKMKKTDLTNKPEIPVKEKTDFSAWQKPRFPSGKFIKQVRFPGSQHRG